jgi:DNA-binding transcriptional regulator YdaS (Cro superfamily)
MSGVRKRYSASRQPALLEQWSKSGESAERFAARLGVKPSTLSRWQRDAKATAMNRSGLATRVGAGAVTEKASTFARVQVVDAPERAAGMVEVVTRAGHVVRVHGDVDPRVLASVLGAVGRC